MHEPVTWQPVRIKRKVKFISYFCLRQSKNSFVSSLMTVKCLEENIRYVSQYVFFTLFYKSRDSFHNWLMKTVLNRDKYRSFHNTKLFFYTENAIFWKRKLKRIYFIYFLSLQNSYTSTRCEISTSVISC